ICSCTHASRRSSRPPGSYASCQRSQSTSLSVMSRSYEPYASHVPLQPSRTVDELRELRELTGDENGAQRVAWSDTWERARERLRGKVAGLAVDEQMDQAGNQWFTLRGNSDRELLIGGHIDSVPNGGWLDGCLNVMGGAEVLRRLAEEGRPAVTVRLVNWAD